MEQIQRLSKVVDALEEHPNMPRERAARGIERALALIAEARRLLTPRYEVRVLNQDGTEEEFTW